MSIRTMLGRVALLAALGVATAGWAPPPGAAVTDDTGAIELDTNTAAVGSALLTFEQHIKWAAVSSAWAAKRDGWVSGVKRAGAPPAVAVRLLELEAAMGWSAVQDSWKSRRDGWVRELKAADTDAKVAHLLMELETTTKWAAVEERWKNVRDGWVSGLTKISRS